jgi:hypothetical protein
MGHTELGTLSVAGEGGLGGTTSTSLKTIPLPNPPHEGEIDYSLVHAARGSLKADLTRDPRRDPDACFVASCSHYSL